MGLGVAEVKENRLRGQPQEAAFKYLAPGLTTTMNLRVESFAIELARHTANATILVYLDGQVHFRREV